MKKSYLLLGVFALLLGCLNQGNAVSHSPTTSIPPVVPPSPSPLIAVSVTVQPSPVANLSGLDVFVSPEVIGQLQNQKSADVLITIKDAGSESANKKILDELFSGFDYRDFESQYNSSLKIWFAGKIFVKGLMYLADKESVTTVISAIGVFNDSVEYSAKVEPDVISSFETADQINIIGVLRDVSNVNISLGENKTEKFRLYEESKEIDLRYQAAVISSLPQNDIKDIRGSIGGSLFVANATKNGISHLTANPNIIYIEINRPTSIGIIEKG